MTFDEQRRAVGKHVLRNALEVIAENGIPAPGMAWLTDVGSDDFLAFTEEELFRDLVESGRSTCRFFDAPYGSGKTHLLDLIHTAAKMRGLAVVRTGLSSALALENWRAVTQHVLQEIELESEGQIAHGLTEILALLRSSGSARVRSLQDATRLPHPGYHRAMLAVAKEGSAHAGYPLLERFLSGERIRVAELRNQGVWGVADSLSSRNAEHVLETVTHGLQLLGVPGTVILFDETERSLETTRAVASMRLREAANVIRRFVDACFDGQLRGVLAVFAVLPGFIDRCSHAYAALGQRLREPRESRDRSWRWPVMSIRSASPLQPAEFSGRVVARLEGLVASQGRVRTPRFREGLTTIAKTVVEQNAGAGYKRPLMKALCTAALEEMNRA